MDDNMQADHDALIRMEGQIGLLTRTVEAHNIASVERDTRIEQGLDNLNGTVKELESKTGILWTDRGIWNWMIRIAVIGTPIAIIVSNYLTQ